MKEPKFKEGQIVKTSVHGETRYYQVLEPVWNKHAEMYLYRLDEPMALPIWREDWLEAISEEEYNKLKQACDEDRVRLHKRGYIIVDGGLAI